MRNLFPHLEDPKHKENLILCACPKMQNTVYARKGRVNVWMILNLSGTIFVELLGVNVITPAFSLLKKGANKARFKLI